MCQRKHAEVCSLCWREKGRERKGWVRTQKIRLPQPGLWRQLWEDQPAGGLMGGVSPLLHWLDNYSSHLPSISLVSRSPEEWCSPGYRQGSPAGLTLDEGDHRVICSVLWRGWAIMLLILSAIQQELLTKSKHYWISGIWFCCHCYQRLAWGFRVPWPHPVILCWVSFSVDPDFQRHV